MKSRKEGTDHKIANMKHRRVRCTQGLFGGQSLLYAVYVFSQKVPSYIPQSSGSLKLDTARSRSTCQAQFPDQQGVFPNPGNDDFFFYGKPLA